MSNQSIKNQIQLVNQAINASINSLNLTKQLVRELEKLSGATVTSMPGVGRTVNLPGIIGTYDGENMITEKGEKFPIPQNYASKSGLVYGDTLKRIEDNGGYVFKQVQRVKRLKASGVLVKKEGRWAAVTSDGSYKVLDRTVEHFGLSEGAEIIAVIPEGNKSVPFAALEVASHITVTPNSVPEKVEEKKRGSEEAKKEAKEEKETPKKSVSKPAPKAKKIESKVVKKVEPKAPESSMTLSEEKPKEKESAALNDDDLR